MSPHPSVGVAAVLGASLLAQTPPPPQAAPVVEAAKPPAPHLVPALKDGDLPCDSKDQQAVIVGSTTPQQILAHRPIFKTNLDRLPLSPELLTRWKNLATPCTLVVAFGSWCGDTQRELPDLLALMAEDNPFVKVHLLGVYRDKKVAPGIWPKELEAQAVLKVPTFWLYELQPGGGQKLIGSIVENPPKKGQRMAEALLDLLETAR